MTFENKRGQNTFCNSKKRIFFGALFGWSLGFAFQR